VVGGQCHSGVIPKSDVMAKWYQNLRHYCEKHIEEPHEAHLNLLYGDEKKYKQFMQKVERAVGRNPLKE